MAMKIIRDECTDCGACIDECPNEAIFEDDEGLTHIDADKCDECENEPDGSKCVPSCAFDAIIKAE